MKGETTCSACGAKIVEYKHTISRGIAQALIRFNESDQMPVKLQDAPLTKNQWTNFQKLRYWGLVKQVPNKTGYWELTRAGDEFLAGKIRVSKIAITYRGDLQRYEGERIAIHDIIPSYHYKQRIEYAMDAEPHFDFSGYQYER